MPVPLAPPAAPVALLLATDAPPFASSVALLLNQESPPAAVVVLPAPTHTK
jgi:hypothetical protein